MVTLHELLKQDKEMRDTVTSLAHDLARLQAVSNEAYTGAVDMITELIADYYKEAIDGMWAVMRKVVD